MPEQFTGKVEIQTSGALTTISLNGNGASIDVGGADHAGAINLQNDQGVETVHLGGTDARIELGASGQDGDVFVKNNLGVETIHLIGAGARIDLGAAGVSGDLYLKNDHDVETVHLGGTDARLELGANGQDGDIIIRNNLGVQTVFIGGDSAMIELGASGEDGDLYVKNDQGVTTIHLSGQTGDIILENADAAEEFDVAESEPIEPGTVVVIGDDDTLHQSTHSYDTRVAGVVTGAGDWRPGIILGRRRSSRSRMPIALMGKVACKVDATSSPIAVGDLLTTSPTPGHAMKASEPLRAFGTVIGKALKSQHGGTGLIPILVALQ